MKNIYDILKEFELEVPEDKKAGFDKAWKENYRTKAEYEKAVSQRDEYKTSLNTVNAKLKEFDGVDVADTCFVTSFVTVIFTSPVSGSFTASFVVSVYLYPNARFSRAFSTSRSTASFPFFKASDMSGYFVFQTLKVLLDIPIFFAICSSISPSLAQPSIISKPSGVSHSLNLPFAI